MHNHGTSLWHSIRQMSPYDYSNTSPDLKKFALSSTLIKRQGEKSDFFSETEFNWIKYPEKRRKNQYGAIELSRPEATTILGAAKIVARTQGGTSFGIMEAVYPIYRRKN